MCAEIAQIVSKILSSPTEYHTFEFTRSFQCQNRSEHLSGRFQLQLIREIIQKYHVSRPGSKRGRPSAGDQPLRLIERHFPSPVPPTPKKYPSRYCHVCSNTAIGEKKIRESRYMCTKCDVGLCEHTVSKNITH
jgi:hypothetical protein